MFKTEEELMNYVRERIGDKVDEVVPIKGSEFACIGITPDNCLMYDYDKLVTYCVDNGMDKEAAIAFVDFNIVQALPYMRVDDNCPIVIKLFS